jgi:hypothetical protein
MQARMSNPAIVVPGALEALGTSTKQGGALEALTNDIHWETARKESNHAST